MSDDIHLSRDTVDEGARWIADARSILVLTGAGISAESGVPTFRGAQGLWRDFRPEELATPEAFARDPRLLWEWYGWRRELVARCRPNEAHLALARLTACRPGARIATQNVDGLHAAAAASIDSSAAPPLELHGSLFRVRCTSCGSRAPHTDPIDARTRVSLPVCEHCGALLRPDIVWFGEALEPPVIGAAFRLAEQADVCLVIGTSGVVQPAASLAGVAAQHGGRVIEVNPDATPLSAAADLSLRATAVEAVPSLLRDAMLS